MFKDLYDLIDKLESLELDENHEDELCHISYDVNNANDVLKSCYRRLLTLNAEINYDE